MAKKYIDSDGLAHIWDKIKTYVQNAIAGVSGDIPYGVCSTAAATQLKEVTINGVTELKEGLSIRVKFTQSQTYNGTPRLKVNSLDAKDIQRSAGTNAVRYEWYQGEVLDLVYDGSVWIISDSTHASTTYYGVTKLVNTVTSTSTTMAATANAVKLVNDELNTKVPDPPTTAGTYALTCTVDSSGNPTYSWQ